MAQALQSAQQSLQQAGQQNAKGEGEQEASEGEMGQEFQPGQGQGQQGGSQQGSSSGGQKAGSGSGRGMGGPGRGAGGSAGQQQPLPGPKKDTLVKGLLDPKGQKLSRSFMGTPDPTQDKAAYYSVVPDKIRAAESSLNKEEIPTAYKRQVKDYFESIQPR